jgi:hypothetical protein
MRLSPLLGVTILLAGISRSAAADIIVWRDASGVSHYTNDLSNVPAEYRGEAMTVAKEWTRALPAAEPAIAVVPTAVSADAAAAPLTREAYEAAYRAGFRAGEQADSPSDVRNGAGTTVQNVGGQSQSPPAADPLVTAPVGELQRVQRQPDGRR